MTYWVSIEGVRPQQAIAEMTTLDVAETYAKKALIAHCKDNPSARAEVVNATGEVVWSRNCQEQLAHIYVGFERADA
jgi:hypothetical protein